MGEHRLHFLNDGEPLNLKLKIKNASEGVPANVNTIWTYMNRRSIVYETSDKLIEPGEFDIRLNRKAGDSENGKYRIDVELNGVPATVVYFIIGDSLPEPLTAAELKKAIVALKSEDVIDDEPDDAPMLSDFQTAKSVFGLTQAPKEIAEVFEPDAPVIYLTMLLSKAPEGTSIRVDWYFLGSGDIERLIIPAELETHGTRQLAFNLKPGTGDLPGGMYEARVFVNGGEFARVPFSVLGSYSESPEHSGNQAS